MASNTIYVMEAVQLFCGDHDPTAGKHLTLAELALPKWQEINADHHAGGARVGIEISVGVEKPEATFKLNGFDPHMLTLFGLSSKLARVYTAYAVVTDMRSGKKLERKVIMEGRLGKNEPSSFQRGELASHDYAINQITHYEDWFDGEQMMLWDFFTNQWVVNGVDENAEINQILRIS